MESYLADGVSLEAYTKFRVSETGVKKKGEDKFQSPNQGLYGWIISATGTTNGTTGTLILTNRNNEPTEIAVSVEKIWGDGAEQHTGDRSRGKALSIHNGMERYRNAALGCAGVPVIRNTDAESEQQLDLYLE